MRSLPACLLALSLLAPATGTAGTARRPKTQNTLVASVPPSVTSWLVGGVLGGRSYHLTTEPWLGLLERFVEPSRNHTPEWRAYYRGAYGPSRAWLPELCWEADRCTPAEADNAFVVWETLELQLELPALPGLTEFDLPTARVSLVGPEPERVAAAAVRPCPRWKAPAKVTVLRYAGERETLALTDCDGAIVSDALDRLSVLARPPGIVRPEFPLPLEPQGEAGEWLPAVRLLHPRLIWAVGEIARSFPGRSIVVMSGYRRDGHSGFHQKGQALDLYVVGVDNEQLFGVCRKLRDAGCGYYPNNRFVHVDVRAYGMGRVAWVDESAPGAPSRYVDGWPGVLAPGAGWLGASAVN